jgi:hypothetical protein
MRLIGLLIKSRSRVECFARVYGIHIIVETI